MSQTAAGADAGWAQFGERVRQFVAEWRKTSEPRAVSMSLHLETLGMPRLLAGRFENPDAFLDAYSAFVEDAWIAHEAVLRTARARMVAGPYVASDPADPPNVVRVRLHDGRRFSFEVPADVLLSAVERAAATLPVSKDLHERSRAVLRDRVDEELVRFSAREWARHHLGAVDSPREPTFEPKAIPVPVQEDIASRVTRWVQVRELGRVQQAFRDGDPTTLRRFLREWLTFKPNAKWNGYRLKALWTTLRRPGWRAAQGDLLAYVQRYVAREAGKEKIDHDLATGVRSRAEALGEPFGLPELRAVADELLTRGLPPELEGYLRDLLTGLEPVEVRRRRGYPKSVYIRLLQRGSRLRGHLRALQMTGQTNAKR